MYRAWSLWTLFCLFAAYDLAVAGDHAHVREVRDLTVTTLRSDAGGAELHILTRAEVNRAPDTDNLEGDIFARGTLWALPCGIDSVTLSVVSTEWQEVLDGEYPDSIRSSPTGDLPPLFAASSVMTLRGMNLFSLAFNPLQSEDSGDGLRWCTQARVVLHYQGTPTPVDARRISRSFYEITRPLVSNLDEIVPAPEHRPEAYLIITNPAYATPLQSFVNWRRARGHTVNLVTTSTTGATNQQIKNYIQDAYDTWAEPPVFVLLVGDVDEPNPTASWLVGGYYHPWIVSDHPYTLLEGTDYLPDVLIGRFSVDTGSEAATVVNKCVNYERNPFDPQGAWRRKMLITGVRSSPGYYETYNSAWPTLEWIGRQFIEVGNYDQVGAVPYPGGSASQINQWLNNGVSFVAYRGFGSPSDWAYPPYNLSQILALTNGQMLPVIASIVCGGGAFESTVDPCFGEVWLRAGTPSAPKGAIGFIGPSEIDTKTRWNNTNIAGIFEGILFDSVETLGAAMLRGKLEMFQQFPNNVDVMQPDADRSVSFYFNTYNLLGDPGLTFFVNDVRDLSADVPSSLALGTPTITLVVTEETSPLAGVWGTVTRADTLISRAVSDNAGQLTLALPSDQAGNVQVTLTKPRHGTVQSLIALQTAASSVGARATVFLDGGQHGSAGNGDGRLNPGEILALGAVLCNYGTAAYDGGTLALASEYPLEILTSQHPVPALAAQAQTDTLWFTAQVAATAEDGSLGRFGWQIMPGDFVWHTTEEIFAPRLTIAAVFADGQEANPAPEGDAVVALWLRNQGRAAHPAFTATLHSHDSRLTVPDSTCSFGAVAPGETVVPNDEFGVVVGNFYPGDWAATEILTTSATRSEQIFFALPIGNLTETDPTHPDGYGYRAFETADTGYTEAPPYAWTEIDPALDGPGTILSLPDRGPGRDTTRTISLPFGFRFYGNLYTQISVCSNGFIAFGQTTESYFRNYSLPAIASPDKMICAFWDDLVVPSGSNICMYYDTTGGRFIVEWSRLRNQYGLGQEETFQVTLYDTACWATRTGDGEILVQYKALANVDSWDNNATIGIQDRDGGYALPISYAGRNEPGVSALRSMQSILFTTGRPDSLAYLSYSGNVIDDDNEGLSRGNGDGIAQNGEIIELAFRIRNTGGTASSSVNAVVRSLDGRGVLDDSITVIPPIAPGETGMSAPIPLHISAQTPNAHVLNFLALLSGDATPCVMLPALTVSSPVLAALPPLFDDDAIPPSIGNDNGELNPGETIELTARAINYGGNIAANVTGTLQNSDGRATVLQSSTFFGDIAPNETTDGQTPLVFRVNSNVSAGQSVSFRIAVADTSGFQASITHVFTVVRPALTAAGLRADDAPPGGDGNGRLTLGESGMLYPRLRNEGGGTATGVVARLASLDTLVLLLDSVATLGTIPPGTTQEPMQGFRVEITSQGTEPRTVPFTVSFSGDDGITGSDEVFLILGDVQFFDDFETDMNYWSVFGSHLIWTRESWDYHSPHHAFYCGNSGSRTYPPGAESYLRSSPFQFSGQGTLLCHTRYEIAAGDVAKVQFQTGNTTYHLLAEFSGSSSGWQEQRFSLAGLPIAEEAYVRFWFRSDWTGEAEGWYVDDVIVIEQDLAVDEPESFGPLPEQTSLESAYPNPFNDRAMIRYRLAETGRVRLTLFDVQGRKVATLLDQDRIPGTYEISWKPLSIASGIYLIQLEAGGKHQVKKLVHLK